MGHLAEPRKKQRLGGDPQNVGWERDKSKFGMKMLQKMGWSEGKGLGKTEEGMTSHIKVSMKRDNGGIGAQRNAGDNWLENTSAFDALLANLNQSFETEASSSSSSSSSSAAAAATAAADDDTPAPAAEKVQTKRNGLYGKFLKGKDLRRYNAKDLGEIFATSRKNALVQDKKKDADEEEEEGDDGSSSMAFRGFSASQDEGNDSDKEAEEVDQFGLKTKTSKQDMYSYFQRKTEPAAVTPRSTPAPGEEEKKTKKKKRTIEEVVVEAEPEPVLDASGEDKPKKKKKKTKAPVVVAEEVAAEEPIAEAAAEQPSGKKKKSKKSSV